MTANLWKPSLFKTVIQIPRQVTTTASLHVSKVKLENELKFLNIKIFRADRAFIIIVDLTKKMSKCQEFVTL